MCRYVQSYRNVDPPRSMGHPSLFGVECSSRFSLRARTDRRTDGQTDRQTDRPHCIHRPSSRTRSTDASSAYACLHTAVQHSHNHDKSASSSDPRITARRCPLCARAPAADIDICRSTALITAYRLSKGQTDRRTDTIPLHRRSPLEAAVSTSVKPCRSRARTVLSYSPGGANIHHIECLVR